MTSENKDKEDEADKVVAIWRKTLIIASARELRFIDLTQQLEQRAQHTFGSIEAVKKRSE